MPLPDGRPSLYDLNPARYSNSRAAADKINQANDARRALDKYSGPKSGKPIGVPQVRQAAINGVATHHADVPAKGSGARGGNPNHDEHGRFT